MGDMKDSFRAIKDYNWEIRKQRESDRLKNAKERLLNLKWKVNPGPDESSYIVISPNEKRFVFWPYTGWFAGKKKGRGIENLIKAGE